MGYITKFTGETDKTITVGGTGNPTSIEGYFLGTKTTPDKGYGEGKLHIFQTKEGVVGVWGKTRMNSLLTDEQKGQMCLLSFTGMIQPKTKGRRPSYGYKLQYDPSNTVDVANVDVNTPAAVEEESSDADYITAGEDSEEFDDAPAPMPQPVAPRVPASAPSADRQARVQALLSKGKSRPL